MAMGRKEFLKLSALSGLATVMNPQLSNGLSLANNSSKDNQIARPTYPQIEWQDSEFGVIFHFDISVATRNMKGNANNTNKKVYDPKKYDPKKLNTDQWVKAAKDAGAAYAVFTATHFCGFLQWQSDLYPYGLKQAKWKNGQGDIVAEFVESCYKYGIKPGLYLSTTHNWYWHVNDHYVNWGKGRGTDKQRKFNRICEKMTEELLSRYGRLLQIWFDAGNTIPAKGGPNVLPVFENYQPNEIFYHSLRRSDYRWVGNEAGYAEYPCWATMPGGFPVSHNSASWKSILASGDPNGSYWSPAMVDVPLRGANGVHDWLYHTGADKGIYSLQQLIKIHEQSVGRNSNMVVGAVINPEGLVPEPDVERLEEFGNALRRKFSDPLGSTEGKGKKFTIALEQPQQLRQYVIQEDIRFGERVRSYAIKGKLSDGGWIEIDTGSCIGHKRIASIDQSEKFSRVLLQINASTDVPHIREFKIF